MTGVVLVAACVAAAPVPPRATPDAFLVNNRGLAVVGPDGKETFRAAGATNGAFAPDGRRIAAVEFVGDPSRCVLVVRPHGRAGAAVEAALLWDEPNRCGHQFVWSADGRRLLVMENGFRPNGPKDRLDGYACRVFDPATKQFAAANVPDGYWVTGWSADGKRLLADRVGDGPPRLAWLNFDGTGDPEYLTPAGEVAYRGRLSPDGRRVLFQAGPKPPAGERAKVRLYVMDLATKARTPIDEPGETHGHCWSPEGDRVAYTWQRSLADPATVAERETILFTCGADGRNRKAVTSRTYAVPRAAPGAGGAVFFFTVLDWR